MPLQMSSLAASFLCCSGERERLAFSRILYHCPVLAIMDEPVSAVGRKAGTDLLQLLQQAGIAAIVTGQIDGHLTDGTAAAQLFSNTILL